MAVKLAIASENSLRFVLIHPPREIDGKMTGGKNPIVLSVHPDSWHHAPLKWDEALEALGKQVTGYRKDGTTYQTKVNAIGCLAGPASGGALFIDVDGESAEKLLNKLGPKINTWKVSSGKPGHYQLLVWVPEAYWGAIDTRILATGVAGPDGKPEHLEFRWDTTQSLVWGNHPEGRRYEWSDTDQPIAICPDWVIDLLLKPELVHKTASTPQKFNATDSSTWQDIDYARSYLAAIRFEDLDWYVWRNVLFACHAAGLGEGEVRAASASSSKHTDKGFSDVWKHIKGSKSKSIGIGTLGYLAKQHGWVAPVPVISDKSVKRKGFGQTPVAQSVKPSNQPAVRSVEPSETNPREEAIKAAAREGYREHKRLKKRRQLRLDLQKVLPRKSARALAHIAGALPTAPEFLLTALLPIAASLIGTTAEIDLKVGWNWTEPCVLWSMGVAPSGSVKSPAMRAILSPLIHLQRLSDRQFKSDKKSWEANRKAAEKAKEEFEEPEPIAREFFLGDVTIEALAKVHEENPKGFLLYRDEIDGFYASQNKYRGTGDDEQRWLTINGGGEIKVNRLNKRHSIMKTAVSMTGTIQPETINEHLRSKKRVHNGMISRWLYCMVELPDPYPTGITADPEMNQDLIEIYTRLNSLTHKITDYQDGDQTVKLQDAHTYYLSPDAVPHFINHWVVPMVDRAKLETHEGIKTCLSKLKGFCARIALVLHLLKWAESNDLVPSKEISLETLLQAIEITEFYIAQAYLAFGQAGEYCEGDDDDRKWSTIIDRLQDAAGRLPDRTITTRIAQRKTALIKSATHARQVFAYMAEIGLGEILIQDGGTPKFCFYDKPTDLELEGFDPQTEAEDTLLTQSIGLTVFQEAGGAVAVLERVETVTDDLPPKPGQQELEISEGGESIDNTPSEIVQGVKINPDGDLPDTCLFDVGDRVEVVLARHLSATARDRHIRDRKYPLGAVGIVTALDWLGGKMAYRVQINNEIFAIPQIFLTSAVFSV